MVGKKDFFGVRKFSIRVLSVLLAAGLLFTGCGGGENAPAETAGNGPVRIGIAAPFTGDLAQFGESFERGSRMAAEEINAKGGILNGRMIEIVSGDDKADPREAVSVAHRFGTDYTIAAVLGHLTSGSSIPASEAYESYRLVNMTPSSTSPIYTERGLDYAFRFIPRDDQNGRQLAEFVVRDLGAKRLLVYYSNNAYGKGLSDIVMDQAEAMGAAILASESYDPMVDEDFRTVLSRWVGLEADALVLACENPKGAMIIRQARQVGITVPVIGGDAIDNSDLWKVGGEAAQGTFVVSYFHYTDPRPEVQAFVERYREQYDEVPGVWAAQCYDGIHLLAGAIDRAGSTDRTAVKEALASTTDFHGVTGTLERFDAKHDPVGKKVIIKRVEGDGFVLYRGPEENEK